MQIFFKDKQHKKFYYNTINNYNLKEKNERSAIYILGINKITRINFNNIFTNIKKNKIDLENINNSIVEIFINLAKDLYNSKNKYWQKKLINKYVTNNLFTPYNIYVKYFEQAIYIRYVAPTTKYYINLGEKRKLK